MAGMRTFVRGRRFRQGATLERPNPLALAPSHSQARLPIQPIRLLPVDLPALTPKQHMNPPIAVATLLRGKLDDARSEEHTSELQSRENLVCRLLLEKKKI